jgi:hypothetical protein
MEAVLWSLTRSMLIGGAQSWDQKHAVRLKSLRLV